MSERHHGRQYLRRHTLTEDLREAWIVVVADKIEVPIQLAQIDGVQRRSHIVGGDKVARAGLAQHSQLLFKKRRVRERLIAIVIQRKSWIWIAVRRQRH